MKWNKLLRRLLGANTVSTGSQQTQQMQLWWSHIIYKCEERMRCGKKKKQLHLPKKERKMYKGKPWFLISCGGGVDYCKNSHKPTVSQMNLNSNLILTIMETIKRPLLMVVSFFFSIAVYV